MAKRTVVWSIKARNEFLQISAFYYQLTGNDKYSLKLLRMINSSLRLIAVFPFMYRGTSRENTRVFVCEYFKIFYGVLPGVILVKSIFDTRQNPDKNHFE